MSTGGVTSRLRPRPFEVACGLALGLDEEGAPLGAPRLSGTRLAVEAAVARGLRAPPCVVSFSGGRDSSAVLATAAAVARREGLPLPIPVTYRFRAAPGSQEDVWQETVVRHLDLPDWDVVPMSSELDTVGPVAQTVLRRDGLLWPFNAHFHVPIFERADGGSVLTGIGGDELFVRQPWSSARGLLSREGWRGETPVRARSVALALAPVPVRRRAMAQTYRMRFPWLRPEVDAAVNRQLADVRARTPVRWDRAVRWWWRSRYRNVLVASMATLATAANCRVVHPFLDPDVTGAAARQFGAGGPRDRSAALRDLFGDLLPDDVLTRRSKAHFDEAFISDHSREFAATWTGAGVDPSIVDPDLLAKEWRSERPDARSLLLMQAAWLAGQ